MTRRYKVALPLVVHTADGAYKQGETFEGDFTEEQEAENLDSGLLELQPMTYEVVGGSRVFGTEPGDTFEAALRIGNEEQLVAGGHIKRIEEEKPAPAPAPRKTTRTRKTKEN